MVCQMVQWRRKDGKWLHMVPFIPTHTNPLNYELHLVNIYYLYYRIEYVQFNTSQFRQRERYQGIWDFSLCLLSHTLLPPNNRDYLNPKFHISHSRISLHRFILIYVCIPSQYSTYWLGFASFWPLHWWTSTWTDGIILILFNSWSIFWFWDSSVQLWCIFTVT